MCETCEALGYPIPEYPEQDARQNKLAFQKAYHEVTGTQEQHLRWLFGTPEPDDE
jgi:hypothetical protein